VAIPHALPAAVSSIPSACAAKSVLIGWMLTLQRDVPGGARLHTGNYAFFAEQAENLFMPSVLYALDEYGIPSQSAERLQRSLLPASSLDEVLLRLGRINLQNADLSPFENDILHDVRHREGRFVGNE
jgi:hypothetical protein